MNSVIFAFFYGLVLKLHDGVSGSRIWAFFGKVHAMFRKGFTESLIINLLKAESKTRISVKSTAVKVLRIPAGFISAVLKMLSPAIVSFCERSVIAKASHSFFNAAAALDIRFFGAAVLVYSAASFVKFLTAGQTVPYLIVPAVIGAFLLFVKARLADFIDGSAVFRFIKGCLGFEDVSFRFHKPYDRRFALFTGALIGLICAVP